MGWRAAAGLLVILFSSGVARAQNVDREAVTSVSGNPPVAAQVANGQDVRKRLGLIPAYENVAGIESSTASGRPFPASLRRINP